MSKSANDVVITTYARTAIDKMGGPLSNWHSVDLCAEVLKELVKRSGLKHEQVDHIFHGTAGAPEIGWVTGVPGRQALLKAGFPVETLSYTIDRACCSGTTAIAHAYNYLVAGDIEVGIACASDNQCNWPLLLDGKVRWNGSRLGDLVLRDFLVGAGYPGFGVVAQDSANVAKEYGIDREMQDRWAVLSHDKWGKAFERGFFKGEIFPLEIPQKGKDPIIFDRDQLPRPGTTYEQLAKLPTVNGSITVTAGNCPSLNAGATGLIMTTRAKAEALGLEPLAKVYKVPSVAEFYSNIATAPGNVIKKTCEMHGLKTTDLGLIEINEAFAAVTLTSTKILSDGDDGKWQHFKDITNVNGGSIAIGHPLGATGIRLTMTMIPELKARGEKYGIATLCGGLAQADGVLIEVE